QRREPEASPPGERDLLDGELLHCGQPEGATSRLQPHLSLLRDAHGRRRLGRFWQRALQVPAGELRQLRVRPHSRVRFPSSRRKKYAFPTSASAWLVTIMATRMPR